MTKFYKKSKTKQSCKAGVIKSFCQHVYKPCKQRIFKHIDKCVKCGKIN